MNVVSGISRQHLIDPETCARCNSCKIVCAAGAIVSGEANFAVKAELCNACGDCVDMCPTGAADHWLWVSQPYTLDEQLAWDALPAEEPGQALMPHDSPVTHIAEPKSPQYTQHQAATATVVEVTRLTPREVGSDICRVVLDLGGAEFAFSEGQSIGIMPPQTDPTQPAPTMRLYSIASPCDGEGGHANHIALIVKRVTEDEQGRPHLGLCSNHLCDVLPGDEVSLAGPFGTHFLMPNDPEAVLLMICTGTGIAPMRAMIERQRRLGRAYDERLVLFYGARRPEEMACHDELAALRDGTVDLNLAFSRLPGKPKRYVQDVIRERADLIAGLLLDPRCTVLMCGLVSMEQGVLMALRDVCAEAGIDWTAVHETMKSSGRFHVEVY